MRTSLPAKDISAVFAGSVIEWRSKVHSPVGQTKEVAKPHASGNPAIYMLPAYAIMVMGVLNWLTNEFPKWYSK